MSVKWRPKPDGFNVPTIDDPMRTGTSEPQKKAGKGKRKCPSCHYRIRTREDTHEKGYHHQHPKEK